MIVAEYTIYFESFTLARKFVGYMKNNNRRVGLLSHPIRSDRAYLRTQIVRAVNSFSK